VIIIIEKRDLAKGATQEAQKRAKGIKEQRILAAEQEKRYVLAEEDANRVIKEDTIRLQQQKQLNKFHNKLYH
jgi:N-acetylglucosamine kinase-like BadF-type ATPase